MDRWLGAMLFAVVVLSAIYGLTIYHLALTVTSPCAQ